MAYTYYPYQPNYFQPPMPDQLTQLRQQQYQPMQQMTQQQAPPSIVWVQSEMEAANYLVAPNSAVTLWPSMKIYDLVERTQRPVQPPQTQHVEYATKEELKALAARLDALTVKETPTKVTTKKTVKEEAE